jgi:hypothetical protein
VEQNPEIHKLWVKRSLEDGKGITAWEAQFLTSLETQLEKGKVLSEKQVEILERIYSEKTP